MGRHVRRVWPGRLRAVAISSVVPVVVAGSAAYLTHGDSGSDLNANRLDVDPVISGPVDAKNTPVSDRETQRASRSTTRPFNAPFDSPSASPTSSTSTTVDRARPTVEESRLPLPQLPVPTDTATPSPTPTTTTPPPGTPVPAPTGTPTSTPTPSPTGTPTSTPTPTPTPSPTEEAGAVEFVYGDQDEDGFSAEVTVTNTTDAPLVWTLSFDYADDVTITDAWDATVVQLGGGVTVSGLLGQTILQPGESATFGFEAEGASTAMGSCSLNGSAC